MQTLEAIQYNAIDNELRILNQLKLPHESIYISITTVEEGWTAIRDMVVRGAPAIAIVGALSLAIELTNLKNTENFKILNVKDLSNLINNKLDYLLTSRPTAVNLANAVSKLKLIVQKNYESAAQIIDAYVQAASKMLVDDIKDNKAIGKNGLEWIKQNVLGDNFNEKISVLTICNTGSLATAGYGTALGIIRSMHAAGILKNVYALETRPYNQGSRLTAYELHHDQIPVTLITDSMAASVLRTHSEIKVVIVGADRVVLNGDTSNKIGTYQLGILSKYHGRKFIVAAPTSSIDIFTSNGKEIEIEERPASEIIQITGVTEDNQRQTISVAVPGINVWNPAFDYVPNELIDVIVTEKGFVTKTDATFNVLKFF